MPTTGQYLEFLSVILQLSVLIRLVITVENSASIIHKTPAFLCAENKCISAHLAA